MEHSTRFLIQEYIPRSLLEAGVELRCPKNDILVNYDDPPKGCYCPISGRICSVKLDYNGNEMYILILEPGNIFCEAHILFDSRSNCQFNVNTKEHKRDGGFCVNTKTTVPIVLLVLDALAAIGIECEAPKATIYVWAKVPEGLTSADFTERLLTEAHVIVTPGNGYGPDGEGFIRISLTTPDDQLLEAVRRIKATL
jgi:hypothetical protein